jgi:transcriptional regulator with XRE-family HTH domain
MSSRTQTSRVATRPSVRRAGTLDSGTSVGARLRERRGQLGLSLRELARRLEVSPSLVSQIETGKIQPSVRTLYAIVNELGLSLDEIFELSGPSDPVEAHTLPRPALRRQVEGDDSPGRGATTPVQRRADRRGLELESGVRWERLTAWNDNDVEFIEAIYEVGGASSPDGKLVRHSGRELGLVLSGTLGVTVGFEEHVLESGDSISFESSIPHRLHNDGDEVVRAIWVTLGRYQSP